MQETKFLTKISNIQKKYKDLLQQLNQHANVGDKHYIKLTKQLSDIEVINECIDNYHSILDEIDSIETLIKTEKDPELIDLANTEILALKTKKNETELEIKSLLIPKSEQDSKDAIVEIRAGTGGAEAALFAQDLLNMYSKYCAKNNWILQILSVKDFEGGGIREAIVSVKGRDVFAKLKFESGVHRVQRIPTTESSGRIHTSAATVAVLPEADTNEVVLQDKDLKIETCRSSGAGGQHVNTTDSAVKVTHLPTGISVVQQEKSQQRNRVNAMNILRAKILDVQLRSSHQKRAQMRKLQVGSGDRSEKIRTYNFPQGRVTDHRINFAVYNINAVIQEGDLSSFSKALAIDLRTKIIESDLDDE